MTSKTLNLEAIEAKEYNTIEYVNLSVELDWFPEVKKSANDYFRGMTLPVIPIEKGMCVYYHDFVRWVRRFAWELQNPIITSTSNLWPQDQ